MKPDPHENYFQPSPPELDADMRVGDLVDELRRLKFAGDEVKAVKLDRHVRDYLVTTLNARRHLRG